MNDYDYEDARIEAGRGDDEDFFPEDYGRVSCSYCDNTPLKEIATRVKTDKYYPYISSEPPDNTWACPVCIKELRLEQWHRGYYPPPSALGLEVFPRINAKKYY